MTTEKPATALSTTDGARCYIAHFFAREMGRHEFATYIATDLAADFACALAQHLAARQPGAQEPVIVEAVGTIKLDDDQEPYIDWLVEGGIHALPVGDVLIAASGATIADDEGYGEVYTAPPAQGIDLGPVREFLRRRMAQWRSHLPSDPGAPGTVAISGDGEGGYNNDVRMYREGIALMDRVLALIDDQRDAAPGVANA